MIDEDIEIKPEYDNLKKKTGDKQIIRKIADNYSRYVETNERRKVIRDLILKEGIVSPIKIQLILKERYNCRVSRNIIYKDLREISNIRDNDLKLEDATILATYVRLREKLQKIIDSNEPNPDIQMKAILALSKMMREQHDVEVEIHMRSGKRLHEDHIDEGSKKKNLVIRFGDEEIIDETKKDAETQTEDNKTES